MVESGVSSQGQWKDTDAGEMKELELQMVRIKAKKNSAKCLVLSAECEENSTPNIQHPILNTQVKRRVNIEHRTEEKIVRKRVRQDRGATLMEARSS